jgi:integrase/recombinase XerC
MPRIPKPWFREDRNAYFVTIRGERHNLGSDKEEADRLFHELMAKKPEPKKTKSPDGLTIAEVFEKFLEWCQKHRASRTYDWYHDHIQAFVDFFNRSKEVLAVDLKPFHVVEWVDSHDTWSPAYRRGAIVAIQRAFNLTESLGYIPLSPIKKIPKPQAQRREQVVSPEEWAKIRDHYKEGDCFRLLLEFGWETGCRPQESKKIEARHVDLANKRVVFPKEESKGKKRIRVILMTPRAEEIVRQLLKPKGLLFLNEDGNPWTAYAMSCRFKRLKKTLGVKYAAYSIRHGFCQRKLEEGNDHLTVAALMGHANGQMVSQVYSHMNQADEHLRKALNGSVEPKVAEG